MRPAISVIFFLILITNSLVAQTSVVKGVVKDINDQPIENVVVSCNDQKVLTGSNGEYMLELSSNKATKITFSHDSFQLYSRRIRFRNKKITIFSPKLESNLSSFL